MKTTTETVREKLISLLPFTDPIKATTWKEYVEKLNEEELERLLQEIAKEEGTK